MSNSKNKELIIEPTDKWLIAKTIESINAENYVLFGELAKKHDVVIKILRNNFIEYKIYRILLNFNYVLPNLPKIYGTYTCYENSKTFENYVNTYNTQKNKSVNTSICKFNHEKNKDNDKIKIKFIVMERISDCSIAINLFKNKKLDNNLFLSILMQGLYEIYQLYYIFGIVIADYNMSNMLVQHVDDKYIEYKLSYNPYRYFKEEQRCCPYNDTWDKITKIKLYGLKIYLIDFDNGRIIHDRFRDNQKSNIILNVIQQLFSFIDNLSAHASEQIINKLQSIYKEKEFLINCCNYSLNDYNSSTKTWTDNCFLIYKTSKILNSVMNKIIKLFNLPNDYMIFN